MNTKEILAKAKEKEKIEEIIKEMKEIKNILSTGSEKEITIKHKGGWDVKGIELNTTDEICKEMIKAFEKQIIKEENKLHEMNGEPLEEIWEEKTNYEEIDTILKEINEDEYENREDKEELLRDYLEDYKKIRKLVEDYYDDIEMLRYKGDDTKDATYNYHRNIKSLFEDIKKMDDKNNDLLAFYDDLHDEVKSAIRDIDKRLESIDEEVDKITGYVDNNR